jgi:hypothetical protein
MLAYLRGLVYNIDIKTEVAMVIHRNRQRKKIRQGLAKYLSGFLSSFLDEIGSFCR